MSFEPTPKEFFAQERPPARLMRFREKFEALAEFGVDVFYCPRFNEAMKNISADTFIRRILIHSLNINHLVIGDDFRFAQDRAGHLQTLQRAGLALGFSVEEMPSVIVGDERVSSTVIRDALWEGDLEHARRLLGKDYRMSGKVIEGNRMGRTLGYPTANVNLNRLQSAVMGIFAVRVSGRDSPAPGSIPGCLTSAFTICGTPGRLGMQRPARRNSTSWRKGAGQTSLPFEST